jgi:NADH-quinone oxidoreductase subunit K
MNIPQEHFLYLAAALFCIGFFAVLTKKNMIIVLIGIELMINASIINLAVFNAFDPVRAGMMMALFAIVLSAAGIAVALAIILKVYNTHSSVEPDSITEMKN